MISKALRRVFLTVSGGILVVALSPPLQRWLDRHGFIPNQYSYGDLYNMTNLPDFKEVDYAVNDNLTKADKPAKHYRDVNLYTIGDSFTRIDTCYYAGNRNVHVWVGSQPPVVASLDTTKKNILIIEFIERVLQERLYWPDYQNIYMHSAIIQKKSVHEKPTAQLQQPTTHWILSRFNPDINQRLEFLLFNGGLFSKAKEAKAQLMLDLFGRVAQASISTNRKHLFYQLEVDTTYALSAFRHILDRKLDTLVNNLNTLRQHYLRMGFNEVYICMVPNKVTILEPTYGSYNHQIERIEAHPKLKVPVISVIDTIRQHPGWYHLGDGHWNKQGKRLWLRRVNHIVAQWSKAV